MIKQDTQAMLATVTQRRQVAEERKAKDRKVSGGWRLLAVQSIACVVLLLLALFVRLGGGVMYHEVGRLFNEALLRNELSAALTEIWDGDPTEMVPSDSLETEEQPPSVA